ncbi:triacylglycerol lipase [Mycena rebaudengoi]|nr:triacylglycerol lipase [Mycena rebaudengoi]
MSEDCLTINVFRPAGLPDGSKLPIMAWIYGGSFFTGTSATFNGTELVARSIARGTPVIYVSFNYRLGPLGFPQGPEAAQRGVLNLGLRDQVLALEWVQENIGAFGGDPTKVTVFGQSAGSVSVGLLYLNNNFASLARAAIFESSQAGTTVLFDSDRAIPQWLVFANNTRSCQNTPISPSNTFTCLLAATSDEILVGENAGVAAMVGEFPFFPVLDGSGGIIPALPSERLNSPAQSGRVPFMSGSDPQRFRQRRQTCSNLYPDVPALGSPFGTGNETWGFNSEYKRAAALLGDLFIQAPRRHWSEIASQHGTKVFSYIFTDPQPENPPFLGVAHLSELPYIYGDLPAALDTPGPQQLSKIMQDYWISFATSLDPNDGKGTDRPIWEEYGISQRIVQLDSTDTKMIADDFRQSQITFINQNSQLFSQ